MNIELLNESLSSIREDLLAFQAQVTDVEKLADLVKQKAPTMWRNYMELRPYMTIKQRSGFLNSLGAIDAAADFYLLTGKDSLTGAAAREVPRTLADLDDIAENLNTRTDQS
jgi:hypothetical protein